MRKKVVLPENYLNKIKRMLSEEDFLLYEESFYKESFSGLRVNTLKISPEEFEKISPFELKKVPWIDNGYYYDSKKYQPAKHPYYFAGLYYLQEPSAMTPANFLPINEGDKVLDICAAPGGKSTELSAKLNGTGLIVSNDVSNSRAKALLKNVEVFGVKNALVISETPEKLLTKFEGYFDKILIDAPCSGEGMFRKDNSMIKNWEKKGNDFYISLQRSIILSACKMLKPNGLLLYSTCTFCPEENEGAIEFLKQNFSDFVVEKLPMFDGFDIGHPEWINSSDESLRNARRLWPHKLDGEGHFICLLRRAAGENNSGLSIYNYKKVKVTDDLREFFNKLSFEIDFNRVENFNDKLYLMPEGLVDIKGLRIMRSGTLLGELKKNRFEPSQAFAMTLKFNEFKDCISLNKDDNRIIKYLKGETIEIDSNKSGWILFCVDEKPLGWGKLNNGILKNKYLAGWRWQ